MTSVVTSRVEKWLQVSIILLTTLGATLLGNSQGKLDLPVLLLFAGVTSVVFTDRLGWFSLPRILANVMMILIAFYWLCIFFGSDAGVLELVKAVTSGSLAEMLGGGTDSFQRLLAIASLLAYVQVVMLYQKKTLRIYGHLAIFSLLQVVIASLLSTSFQFGIALMFYAFAALFTLSLFYIFRQGKQVQRGHYRARRKAERDWKRQKNNSPLDPRLAIFGGTSPISSPDRKISSTTASILGWGFTRHLLSIGLCTVAFSIVFFFCMPRSGNSSWQQPGFGRYKQVGFRRDVQLSDVGKLLLSEEIALRVSLTDLETGEPYKLFGEPYLRGAVLSRYRYDNEGTSRWFAMDPSQGLGNEKLPTLKPLASRDLVKQEFLMELNDDPALMALFPAYQLPETDQHVSYDPATNQLYLARTRRSPVVKQYRYVLATDAFRSGVQSELQLLHLRSEREEEFFKDELAEMISLPPNLQNLKRFTRDLLDQGQVPEENLVLKCRTLEQFLKSDEFRYTLDLNQIQPMRQMNRDQVEDFLLNHRMGNCEYFASALVLMLRSQGIPARMAIGFRGGEFNPTGNYFTVHQYNAHAWVEALLPAEGLSPALVEGVDHDTLRGIWLRLDPTPIFRPDETPPERTFSDQIVDSFDYMQLLWDNNVLRLNAQQQRQTVFNRIGWNPDEGFQGMASLPVIRWFRVDFSRGLWAGILSWNFLAWLILLPLVGWLVHQLRRRLADRQDGSSVQKPASRRQILQKAQCDFFLHFEQLLQRHGFCREPAQTQQEFVRVIEKQLVVQMVDFSGQQLLTRMVETYYRVRFGHQPLDEDQQQLVSKEMDQLADLLMPASENG